MQARDIEVGFFLSCGAVPELESVHAWHEDIAFYVGHRHPLANKEVVTPAELSRYPFYYLPDKSHLRSQMDAVLSELEIQDCPTALVSDDHTLIAEGLSDGKSFACLFAQGIEALNHEGLLMRLNLSRPMPRFDVRYAVRGPIPARQNDARSHGVSRGTPGLRHAAGSR